MWAAEYLFIWTNRKEYYWLSTLKFKFVYQLIEQKKKLEVIIRMLNPVIPSFSFIFRYYYLLLFFRFLPFLRSPMSHLLQNMNLH